MGAVFDVMLDGREPDQSASASTRWGCRPSSARTSDIRRGNARKHGIFLHGVLSVSSLLSDSLSNERLTSIASPHRSPITRCYYDNSGIWCDFRDRAWSGQRQLLGPLVRIELDECVVRDLLGLSKDLVASVGLLRTLRLRPVHTLIEESRVVRSTHLAINSLYEEGHRHRLPISSLRLGCLLGGNNSCGDRGCMAHA